MGKPSITRIPTYEVEAIQLNRWAVLSPHEFCAIVGMDLPSYILFSPHNPLIGELQQTDSLPFGKSYAGGWFILPRAIPLLTRANGQNDYSLLCRGLNGMSEDAEDLPSEEGRINEGSLATDPSSLFRKIGDSLFREPLSSQYDGPMASRLEFSIDPSKKEPLSPQVNELLSLRRRKESIVGELSKGNVNLQEAITLDYELREIDQKIAEILSDRE